MTDDSFFGERTGVQRQHPEDELQRSVVQYLHWALPADACFTAFPAGEQRHTRAAQRLVGLGLKPGWPDLQVVWRSRYYGIELKAPRGTLSEVQRQMHRKLQYCGASVLLCRSADCVENALRELGLPLRGHVQ